jgi:hypothetical protein
VGSTVNNVVLLNANVTGNNDVGALVGWSEAEFVNLVVA